MTQTHEHEANWSAFTADFLADAPLFPTSRPAQVRSMPDFLARVQVLPKDGLGSFEQSLRGTKIMFFGNTAVAFGVCENLKNKATVERGIETFPLVKEDRDWQIAAQA